MADDKTLHVTVVVPASWDDFKLLIEESDSPDFNGEQTEVFSVIQPTPMGMLRKLDREHAALIGAAISRNAALIETLERQNRELLLNEPPHGAATVGAGNSHGAARLAHLKTTREVIRRGPKLDKYVQARRGILFRCIGTPTELKDEIKRIELFRQLDGAKIPVPIEGRATMKWIDLKGALRKKA